MSAEAAINLHTYHRYAQKLRCVEINNQPWFSANDLGRILCIDTCDAIHQLHQSEVQSVLLPGRYTKPVRMVCLSGLYQIACASRARKELRHAVLGWLKEEVFPRYDGRLILAEPPPRPSEPLDLRPEEARGPPDDGTPSYPVAKTYTYGNTKRGGDLRCIEIDNQPWFVLTDVARILGHPDGNLSHRVDNLKEADKAKVRIGKRKGGAPQFIISARGFRKMVAESRKTGRHAILNWFRDRVAREWRSKSS